MIERAKIGGEVGGRLASERERGDEHDRLRDERVRPPGWQNPEPARRYDMVVIGGGTAGLVTAVGSAGVGARVALVERERLGGDCLNAGCVPSKALIRSARAAREVRAAERFGVRAGTAEVDFPAVMERMRRLRAEISRHDAAQRLAEKGVDVFLGEARFAGPREVRVGGAALRFRRACIATGTRPAALPIEGLDELGYLTNETLFSLRELPPRLAVIGGGPIGCEMAQSFARFGARVTILEKSERLLAREPSDASRIVAEAFRRDGVEVLTGVDVDAVRRRGTAVELQAQQDGTRRALEADRLLVAVGRAPNVEGLGLAEAGVEYDPRRGVHVDGRLRTSNRSVFAAGDVCSTYKFTHTADALARIVIRNALFFGRASADDLVVPWCTYTDPEVAHTGLSEEEAREQLGDVEVVRVDLAEVDRAVLEGEHEGFLEVRADGKGRIVGATLVAAHAGEMISELTLAIRLRRTLADLSQTIHPYPTQAEVLRKAGDAHQRGKLTPLARRFLKVLLALPH